MDIDHINEKIKTKLEVSETYQKEIDKANEELVMLYHRKDILTTLENCKKMLDTMYKGEFFIVRGDNNKKMMKLDDHIEYLLGLVRTDILRID
jgi:hypothetical protein